MAWRLSTGMKKALLQGQVEPNGDPIIANDIAIEDGTGPNGEDKLVSTTTDLSTILRHDFLKILVQGGNNGKVVKVIQQVSNHELLIEHGVLSALAAGPNMCLMRLKGGGSIKDILRNGVLVLYTGTRPSDADQAETGTKLVELTLDSGGFVAGVSANGLNLGHMDNTTLKRAIDPETGVTEIWRGLGLADGSAGWARWYSNEYVTGASTDAVRMDGVVATSGADVNMPNGTAVTQNVHTEINDVSFTATGV